MNEHDLQRRLGQLVADQPAPRLSSTQALAEGRRRVRTRRVVGSLTGCALTVAAVAGVTAVWPADPTSNGAPAPAAADETVTLAQLSDAEIVQRCVQADNSSMSAADFGAGSRVLVSEVAGQRLQAVIVADQADVWAQCGLFDRARAEFDGYSETYPMDVDPEPAQPRSEMSGFGFGPAGFTWTDRYPADVHRIEVRFRGGPTLTRRTVDGFVVFNAAVDVLEPGTGSGEPMQTRPFRVTLYADDGSVLGATSNWVGQGPELTLPPEYHSLVPLPVP